MCVCACALRVSMCMHASVCVCAPSRVRASVCAHLYMYVCTLTSACSRWEGSSVFASTALVVVWTAVCLTSYRDYLTNFQHLSRCHTGFLKKKSSAILLNLKKTHEQGFIVDEGSRLVRVRSDSLQKKCDYLVYMA